MLLAFGGALMVVGLVILLWVNEYFQAAGGGRWSRHWQCRLARAGWWLLRSTRYQLAGRALTLLACLVMPLNLWYYHANHLVTLDGHLWVAAVTISALYAASALVLRDALFVYIFIAGVTLTGLLVLADIPPSPHYLLETAAPATLLVVLGLLAIHIERAFPPQDVGRSAPTVRTGLLLVRARPPGGRSGAGARGPGCRRLVVSTDLRRVYRRLETNPSPIVGELRGWHWRWSSPAPTPTCTRTSWYGTSAFTFISLPGRCCGPCCWDCKCSTWPGNGHPDRRLGGDRSGCEWSPGDDIAR